jgi:membrane-anchored protein YejM (alkaline phosphatase superfamily)
MTSNVELYKEIRRNSLVKTASLAMPSTTHELSYATYGIPYNYDLSGFDKEAFQLPKFTRTVHKFFTAPRRRRELAEKMKIKAMEAQEHANFMSKLRQKIEDKIYKGSLGLTSAGDKYRNVANKMRAEEDALYNKYKRLNERRRGLLGLSW